MKKNTKSSIKFFLLFSLAIFTAYFTLGNEYKIHAATNTSSESAMAIVDGQEISTSIDSESDEKWFKVNIEKTSSIISTVSMSSGYVYYELYDSTMKKVKSEAFSNRDEMIGWKAEPGEYYIRFRELLSINYMDNSISLKMDIKEEDQWENNDTAEKAVALTPGEELTGIGIEASNDYEWFKINVEKRSSIVSTVSTSEGSLYYKLYDSDMNRLRNEIFTARDKNIAWKVEPGVYYIRLSDATSINYLENSTSLKVDIKEEDQWENNDTAEKAVALTPGEELTGIGIEASNDYEWFKINVEKRSSIVSTVSTSEGSLYYKLYDSNMNRLRNEIFTARDKNIAWKVEPGVYYIRLSDATSINYLENSTSLKVDIKEEDQWENNDTAEKAVKIEYGKEIDGISIEAENDYDWFKTTLSRDGELSFDLVSTGWIYYELYDSDMNRIKYSYVPSNRTTNSVSTLSAGEYYIRLKSYYTSTNYLSNTVTLSTDVTYENAISGKHATEKISKISSAFRDALSFVSDPVDTATGAQVFHYDLLKINGAQPLHFEINYNSLLTSKGNIGVGWEHNYETQLVEVSDSEIEIQWSSNRKNTFAKGTDGVYHSNDYATQHDQLQKNEDGTFTLKGNNQKKYTFNPTGKLIEQYNENGQVIQLEYTADGKLSQVVEPVSGQSLQFGYNLNGLLAQVSDISGREISFTYDKDAHLLNFTSAKGDKTSFSYNEKGWITEAYTNETKFLANTYDLEGRVKEQDDAVTGNDTTVFTYDEVTQPGKLITTVNDRNGNERIYTHNTNYQVLSLVDELSHTITTNKYDTTGNLIEEIDANGHKTTYTYDEKGNMLSETTPDGSVTTLTYDERNNLLSTTNELGGKITFTYDAHNNVLSKSEENNETTTFKYNENNRLVSETNPLNQTKTYTYHNGLLSSVTDALSRTTAYEYDSVGRKIKTIDAAGRITSLSYDKDDNVVKKVNPAGNVATFTFDHNKNKLKETDPAGNSATYSYNANGKLVSKTDSLGRETKFEYDGEDRLTATTYPDGNVYKKHYDAKGRVVKEVDQLGRINEITYDPADNIIKKVDPYGNKVSFVYDSRNNIVEEINKLGNSTIFQYDALNQLIKETSPDGSVSSYTYDLTGNLLKQTDPAGGITNYNYDAAKQLVKTSYPDGSVEEATYDATGNLISSKQPDGTTLSYEYDDVDQLIKTIEPDSQVTVYNYDASGNRTKVTNANSNTTTYKFDSMNRLVEEVDPLGHSKTYVYDAAGNMIQKTDAKEQTTTYAYDKMDNLITNVRPDGSSISYKYDSVGNRISMTDHTGQTAYVYDNLNQLTSVSYPGNFTVQYDYDAAGNKKTLTYPDDSMIQYDYDKDNRLIKTTDWMGRENTIDYDSRGLVQKEILPNGVVAALSHNSVGNVTEINYLKGESVLKKHSYEYNLLRNRTSETNEIGEKKEFSYDSNQQLIEVTQAEDIIADYAYDKVGNRISSTDNGQTESYTYDAAERITAVEHNTTNTTPYTFDANGNMIKQGETSYTFDFENNLETVDNENEQVNFIYNGDNHKTGKTVNGQTTRYIYDIVNDLPQLLMEVNDDGTVLTKYYRNTAVQETNGQETIHYYMYDGLGSVTGLLNPEGEVISEYAYDAFGKVSSETGETSNEFTFAGEQKEKETGLLYLRARHYDPAIGRFISKDPFGGFISDPRSLNDYSYAYNNPVNLTDPSGENPFLAKIAIDTVVGVGVDYLIQGEGFSLGKSVKANSVSSIGPGSNGFKKGKELLSFVQKNKGIGNVPKYNRADYGTTPTKSARENTFKRDNYTCQYCGSKNAPLEADHNPSLKSHWYQEGYKMSPEARNAWANNLDNLTTSCRSCNRSKGAKNYPGEWTAADKYKTRNFRLK